MRQKAKNTMKNSQLIEIAIKDGTIVNRASVSLKARKQLSECSSLNGYETSRWSAVVTKNASQPDGLARHRLNSRDFGKIISITGVDLSGKCIEMVDEISVNSDNGDSTYYTRDHRYFMVEGSFTDRLILRQIEAVDVPEGQVDTAIRDSDPEALLLKIIDGLREQVTQLQARVDAG